MSEPENSKHQVHSTRQLREQAGLFRQLARDKLSQIVQPALSPRQRAVHSVLIVLSLALVIALIGFPEGRRQMVQALASSWGGLEPPDQGEIYPLPPPPPRSTQTRVVAPGVQVPAARPAAPVAEPRQPLFSETTAATRSRQVPPPPPSRTSAHEASFRRLQEGSETARKLVANEISDLEFKSWRPVQDRRQEHWLDLVARRRSDGSEVHFIWAVDSESGAVRAMSQAARDLERGTN